MNLTLNDTSTKEISAALLGEEFSPLATGRVLTLLVVAEARDDLDSILDTIRDAMREHPARILVLVRGDKADDARLDANIYLDADSGANEMVVMNLHGELVDHLDSVVTPLLLPDTPIAAWWPRHIPASPIAEQISAIARRRITNTLRTTTKRPLELMVDSYEVGDSDMAWSRITQWRGIVASALDRNPGARIDAVRITGPSANPSVDLAAGWLASCLDVEVERLPAVGPSEIIRNVPITELVISREDGEIAVTVVDERSVRVTAPQLPDSYVALTARTDAECLAEELRHLDPDAPYARALQGLSRVVSRGNGHTA
ncbi:glucose-6-phosphate dehydrogenase assembly protein OpcA [Corynebacterium sp. LK2510]|uniref:glucose-6-phosphate dehydrogenase assembly protein OpcA n=1 Tax=Corynebacterium sp. LK2510 TaxID=3110472 RepID=UPI0034CED369